jgi:NAD+ kinase
MKKSLSLAEEIYQFLTEYGSVLVEKDFAKKLDISGSSLETMNKKADIVVTVGGDGTIIRTIRYVDKPIFSINSGGMGFLAEVESKYALNGLKQVIDGKYTIEKRAKLKTLLNEKRLPDAANEVTLQTAQIAKIMYFQIFVENDLVETLGADGVIVATPTGSTSYSLSVGGPIMDPSVEAMIVAPLAPFRLSTRPWVVPLRKKVKLKILPKSKSTTLVVDGNYSHEVSTEDDIVVTESEKKAQFIRFGESFYQMVRMKLVR